MYLDKEQVWKDLITPILSPIFIDFTAEHSSKISSQYLFQSKDKALSSCFKDYRLIRVYFLFSPDRITISKKMSRGFI